MKVFAHAHSGCQSEQSPSIKLIMETGRSYAFQAKLSFTATTVPPSKCPPDHPTPKFNAPTYSIRHNAPYLMIESTWLLRRQKRLASQFSIFMLEIKFHRCECFWIVLLLLFMTNWIIHQMIWVKQLLSFVTIFEMEVIFEPVTA